MHGISFWQPEVARLIEDTFADNGANTEKDMQ